jgi:type IV pilus assembly protein PilO
MDFKDSKTQKIALGALAFLFVVYFWYTRVYSVNAQEITQKTQEFEVITTNLKNVEMKAKSLDALKLEYEDLLVRYHEIEQLLPEVKQIPSFLVQLHTASSLSGTRITKVKPLPISGESFYNVVSFDIELDGTFHDYGSFISYVANFPFITNVSDVELTAVKSGNVDTKNKSAFYKKETVNTRFTLSTYYVKENERLQELVL